jgi:hypothetical protein
MNEHATLLGFLHGKRVWHQGRKFDEHDDKA